MGIVAIPTCLAISGTGVSLTNIPKISIIALAKNVFFIFRTGTAAVTGTLHLIFAERTDG
jgi:hypothetical protein